MEDTPKPWSIASGGSHSSLGARVCSRSPIFGEPRYNGRRTNARRHSSESSGIGAPLLIMSAFQPPRPSRRRLLRTGALALGSLCVSGARTPLVAQEPQSVVLPTYVADVDGSGSLDSVDERLVRNALYSQRGFGLSPVPGFDLRADVFGRGSVDVTAVDAVRTTLEAQVTGSVHADQRPITVAWHYGWYNNRTREPGMHTVQFKGGDYSSRDVDVETLFNDQKNEFGITVDALSWIPVRSNNNIVDNYRLGLLSTPNLHTRYLSLLYESTLALPLGRDRIDFLDASVSVLLQEDFDQMGRFLANARDGAGARVFTLDGRPVVFIFGSHTWGLLPLESAQFTAFEVALDRAREAFRVRYGSLPFLVGEEKILSAGGVFADDRVRHMASFDAAYVYHHASLKPLSVAPGTM